ncbi:uncharacterized protein C17orf53 homolog, partial [Carlito syrichta]|uniref:Uncharacterized protein C17orf53 homolog n=1 Tax=Carlito syrichta TaxID=1868482 RepID=A0A1U7T8M8_CARSF
DFLSAVEDVENQFASSAPMNAGCLRPSSSRLQAQSSRPPPVWPMAPSETLGLPAVGLCLPASSIPGATGHPSCMGTIPQRPGCASSSWTGTQRRGMPSEAPRELAGPLSLAPHPLLTSESQQWWTGGFEGPEQDEFDKILASMELDRPGVELEDPALAKKARVVDHSVAGITSSWEEPLDSTIHGGTPPSRLRPGAASHFPVPPASAAPVRQVCPQGPPVQTPQPPLATGGPVQGSPQHGVPSRPFQSPDAWFSALRPRTPASDCSAPSRTGPGLFPQGLTQPRTPVSSVESPLSTPKGPRSSLVPQGALQTPMVTNHLVQLVTAAHRTPQRPTHSCPQAKARRFPGPAGILPHQHDGKNLEEIMVSAPPTPTHGALAKFQTETAPSSQASEEDDFGRGPWLAMKSALGLDERDPGCFLGTCSIVMVLRKAALRQLPGNKVPRMAVMIKSLTRSAMDASVVFKDPTGEMQGTVHRLLLETRQNELRPGSVLLLKQIGVFSPSTRNHYLNVTPTNLVHVYSPDSGASSTLLPSQPEVRGVDPCPQDSGSLRQGAAKQPREGPRAGRSPKAGVVPEEELPEADDLDGLLSELPEDFFHGASGHPP